MHIRTARPDDAAGLAALSAELGYPCSTDELRTRLAAVLGRDGHTVVVACEDDGAVIGWLHVFLALRVESAPFAELGGLVVAERCRRRGAGRQLVAQARAWAIRRDVRRLRVRTRVGRADAEAFYERLGFAEAKQQRVFDLVIGGEA